MIRGLFITFEGTDGSGITTILNKLITQLVKHNLNVFRTREPGGQNKVSQDIRGVLLNHKDVDKYAESLMFAASRVQHVSKYIIPQISEGISVISDHY